MADRPLILVVDDDAPILLLMRNLLREFGFEPVAAASGQQAIEEASKRRPDLILLDLNMPGMTADEVLRGLRGIDGVASTPVLIVSGAPLEPEEIDSLGAAGAILKPFDVSQLVSTIRQHLNGRS
jgi:DNA-binding response OmpR family regulator